MTINDVKVVSNPHSANHFPEDKSGEQKIGGHATNLGADDNADEAAESAGLYTEDKPEAVGLGGQNNKSGKIIDEK